MASLITMPKLSDTMEEGGIANWIKKEGERIEEGDPLVEIETDKATVEYASPFEGTLLKILVPAGKSGKLQVPIAVLGSKGETFDLDKLLTASGATSSEVHHQGARAPSIEKNTKELVSASASVSSLAQDSRVKASPLAKKIAKSQGLDIQNITGSGPNGRVVVRDLSLANTKSAPSSQSVKTESRQAQQLDQKIPLSMMRKTIARRLLSAKNEAPHFYLTISANMERMLSWKDELNAHKDVLAAKLPKVSMNDLVILATAKALSLHPEVNASWEGEFILQHGAIHVAFAVALPGGLITPVISHTDTLGIREIARQSKFLGEKARNGELKTEEYSGGTFTISNLGMTGVEEFTAIINPPQVCILAVGRTQKIAHVNDEGVLVAQSRMKMTLSCDHRVVDGMVGARFLETLVSYLENPLMMLA